MTPIALARLCVFWSVMNATVPETMSSPAWRIVVSRAVHIGLRPAAANGGAGMTLQVTTDLF